MKQTIAIVCQGVMSQPIEVDVSSIETIRVCFEKIATDLKLCKEEIDRLVENCMEIAIKSQIKNDFEECNSIERCYYSSIETPTHKEEHKTYNYFVNARFNSKFRESKVKPIRVNKRKLRNRERR